MILSFFALYPVFSDTLLISPLKKLKLIIIIYAGGTIPDAERCEKKT